MNRSQRLLAATWFGCLSLATPALPGVSANGPAVVNAAAAPAIVRPPVDALIVRYRARAQAVITATAPGAEAAAAARLVRLAAAARVPLVLRRSMALGATVYQLATPLPYAEAVAAAARIELDPEVEFAEPDLPLQSLLVPNDPSFVEQWTFQPPATSSGGANLTAAWDISTGAPVVVAVIDTGVLFNHPDLLGRLLPGVDLVSGRAATATCPANWNAGDGDGRDADPTDPGTFVTAADAAACNATQRSSIWHGTHVAGTIGAATDNGFGIAGINWQSQILPVRVLGKGGAGLTSDVADGIAWAAGISVPGVADNPTPARILNLSLGSSGTCSNTFRTVLQQVAQRGVVVVAAAGNASDDVVDQPANCPGVIAVTAHAADGDLAYYANIGPEISLSGPGGGCGKAAYVRATNTCSGLNLPVLSAGNDGATVAGANTFTTKSGTSMAVPHVVGVASLLVGLSPALDRGEVRAILENSARPFLAGGTCATNRDGACGAGLLDAGAALAYLRDGLPTVDAGLAQIVAPGTVVTLSGAAAAHGGRTLVSLDWEQVGGAPVALDTPAQSAANFTAPLTGRLEFRLLATDSQGYVAGANVNVRVNSPPTVSIPSPPAIPPGSRFNFRAVGNDPDGDPVTLVAAQLPDGATFDAATGDFTFTPTTVGTYTLTVFARDDLVSGPSVTRTLVVDANAPPPADAGGGVGSTAQLDTGGGGGGAADPVWALAALLLLGRAARARRPA